MRCLNETGERTNFDNPRRLIWFSFGECGYWTDDLDKINTKGVPCCPICGAVGFQQTYNEWIKEIEEFDKDNPNYTMFIFSKKEICSTKDGNTILERYHRYILSEFNLLKEYIERESLK